MPAMITHYLFTLRVLRMLEHLDIDLITDKNIAVIGAQGPDVFLYHRIMPWQREESYAKISSDFHRSSPVKTFGEFAKIIKKEARLKEEMLNYVYGFICHYALDRCAHPFINAMAAKLKEEQPKYAYADNQYHFRIESALDTIILRRETGRFVGDFKLSSVLPANDDKNNFAIGKLYRPAIFNLFNKHTFADSIAKAPSDMKNVFSLLSDRSGMKKGIVNIAEKVISKGTISSSLIRPFKTDDWDYANDAGLEWVNPCNNIYSSEDSFFDIFRFAVSEAVDMIIYFNDIVNVGAKGSMLGMTQDRGFITDLPGVYDERNL